MADAIRVHSFICATDECFRIDFCSRGRPGKARRGDGSVGMDGSTDESTR